MKREVLTLLATAALTAAACTNLDRLTETGPGGPLVIRAEGDTAATTDTLVVGQSEWLMVVGADTTSQINWTISDASIVEIQEQYFYRLRVRAVQVGRATVTAAYEGKTGTFDLVVRGLFPSDTGLVIQITSRVVDTALVGDTVGFGFNIRRGQSDFVFGVPFRITFSDSTILQLVSNDFEHVFAYQARRVGATFIKVTCCDGKTDSSQVIVTESPQAVPDPRASRYEAIDLGTFGGDRSYPIALNDNGQVVGYSVTADGKEHAFLWDNGVMRDLSAADDQKGAAYVITNSGVVAGTYTTAGGVVRVFVWQNGVRTDLGSVGCCDQRGGVIGISETDVVAWGDNGSAIWQNGVKQDLGGLVARAMNSRHQVIGMRNNHPFIWDNGVARPLEVWGAGGKAVDINSDGVVVGQTASGWGDMGLIWVDGRVWRDFGWTHPVAINDAGDVAAELLGSGYYYPNTVNGPYQSLSVGSLGAGGTTVVDMNDRAMIVGSSWTAARAQHAYVWQPMETKPIDLGTGPSTDPRLGSAAVAVNARGDIIGWAAPCTTPTGRCTELDQSRTRAILWRLKN